MAVRNWIQLRAASLLGQAKVRTGEWGRNHRRAVFGTCGALIILVVLGEAAFASVIMLILLHLAVRDAATGPYVHRPPEPPRRARIPAAERPRIYHELEEDW